ncbi:MAG: hypothetical protein EOP11_01010 [Proteobacteria bacterium]|nr:MAG: hypothetical protein EOP11_01010 [Pseudomonadota bacterium]
MTPRVLLIAILLLLTAPAYAATTVNFTYCHDAFNALVRPAPPAPPAPAPPNYPPPNVWTPIAGATPKQTAALNALTDLEAKKAIEIFPKTISPYGVTKSVTGEEGAEKAFQKAFDQIWDTRIKAGLVPKFEITRYRKWLLAQNSAKPLPYPAIDPADFYTKFIKNDRPISEFFNEKFLEFVEKEKGTNFYANVNDYFKEVDRSWVKYKIGQTWNGTKAIGRKLKSNFILLPTGLVGTTIYAYQTELFNKATGYFIGTGKDALNSTVASGLENGINSLWGFATAGDLETAFNSVNVATEDLAKAPFEPTEQNQFRVLNRQMGRSAIVQVRKKYEAIMPDFKAFIETYKKGFDDEKKAYLKEMSGHSRDARNYYEEARTELNRLEKDMAAEQQRLKDALMNPNSTAEEKTPRRMETEDLETMATLRAEMVRNENFIAKTLGKYLLYSSTRGSKNPVDEAIAVQYEKLFEDYMERMPLSKLQSAWLSEVNEHTAMIKSFMPKSVAAQKTNTEKAQEGKAAALAKKATLEEANAKAEATAKASAKLLAEKGAEAAKDSLKEAKEAQEKAVKALAEYEEAEKAAKELEQKAAADPTAKTGPEPAASILPIPLPIPIPGITRPATP